MTRPDVSSNLIATLLARSGVDAHVNTIAPLSRGGNNRIFRVEGDAGVFAAKQYFRHKGDTRDRLTAEFAFLQFALLAAPGYAPRPFACDRETGVALYEFINGMPFQEGQLGAGQVKAAIRFFETLNAPQLRANAQLPVASEACFSIAGHLALVNGRIEALLGIAPRTAEDAQALALIGGLKQLWNDLSMRVRSDADREGLLLDAPLAAEHRCISPSDFGFHNALQMDDGSIRFLDFEYAGWDDPAKMAGDFFAQLAVPVPARYFDEFVDRCMQPFPDAPMLAARARILRPVYQLKWCAIALNVFLPVHLERRKFANPALDEAVLKRAQLVKADKLFQFINTANHALH